MKTSTTSSHNLQTRRLMLFRIIAISLPLLLVIIPETLLRIGGYGEDYRLFVQVPEMGYEEYLMVNPIIGKKYFHKFGYTSPPNDIFLRKKPDNTFRLFVMGSSVVYGFPYDRNLMFSRVLHQMLEDTYPDLHIEVINTSVTAVNTHTLRDFTKEILRHKPDAILIYEGHNEFYGAFGSGSNEGVGRSPVLIRLHLRMMDLRTYQWLRNALTSLGAAIASRGESGGTQETLMKRIVQDNAIPYDSRKYKRTMRVFRNNLDYITSRSVKKGVPVFLSELVSNVSGMEPFVSVHKGDLPPAEEIFKQARQDESLARFDQARELYYRAKDLDGLRFRATEEASRIVREITRKDGVYLVEMQGVFEDASPNRLIGYNLMTEHVHPNIDGVFLMGNAFYETIIDAGIAGYDPFEIKPMEYYRRNWGYTRLDTLLAYHRIRSLTSQWPFVKEGDNAVSYIETFRPQSFSDSITFAVMRRADLSLAEARLDIAKRLQQAGRTESAFYEYRALIHSNPYRANNFRDAAQCLLELGDLPGAMRYFERSLRFAESWFAMFRLAEIEMMKGNNARAIELLDRATPLAPENYTANVLGRLHTALIHSGDQARGAAVAAELRRMGEDRFLRVPARTITFGNYIPFQTRSEIEQARSLVSQNQIDEAIEILKGSLMVYDSHVARKMLGELYFQTGDHQQASAWLQSVKQYYRFDPRFLHLLNLTIEESAK